MSHANWDGTKEWRYDPMPLGVLHLSYPQPWRPEKGLSVWEQPLLCRPDLPTAGWRGVCEIPVVRAWWCCCSMKQADGDPWDAAESNLFLERTPGVSKTSRKPTFPTFEWTDLICPSRETEITSITGSWLSSVLPSGLSSTILENILREFDVYFIFFRLI